MFPYLDYIRYNDGQYPLRLVNVKTFGVMPISTTDLSDKLLTEKADYVSDEAMQVDEQIFFYVEPSKISLSEKELSAYIYENL